MSSEPEERGAITPSTCPWCAGSKKFLRADVSPDFAAAGLYQQRGTIADALVVEVAQVPSDQRFQFPLQAGVYGGFDEAALATAFERARQVRCPNRIP